MNRAVAYIILSGIALMFSAKALAYVGPALGLGIVGTVVAVIAVSLLSIFAFVVIPIRRMFRNKKKKTKKEASDLQR